MLYVWSVIDILFKNSFLFVRFLLFCIFSFPFILKKAPSVCFFMLFGEVGRGGGVWGESERLPSCCNSLVRCGNKACPFRSAPVNVLPRW